MTNELQIFCSLPKCEKDADTECIDCKYMVREEPKKMMTNKEAREILIRIAPMPRRGDGKSITQLLVMEAFTRALKALEQQPIDKSAMMFEIYMEGVNMSGEYQGCWVRFKDIEKIVDRYIKGSDANETN